MPQSQLDGRCCDVWVESRRVMGWAVRAQPQRGGASAVLLLGDPLSTKERAGEETKVEEEEEGEGEEETKGNSVPDFHNLWLKEGKCGSESSNPAHFDYLVRYDVVMMEEVEAVAHVLGAAVAGRAYPYQALQLVRSQHEGHQIPFHHCFRCWSLDMTCVPTGCGHRM